MEPYYERDGIEIYHGDCLQVMADLAGNSVGLIATDPPYFKFKDESWDRQWADADEFLDWMGALCEEWRRVLAPNGSLYVFASPQMAARVECKIAEYFNVLNRIVWRKHDGAKHEGGRWEKASKDAMRSFFPRTEYVIFAEQYGADGYASGETGYSAKCDELRGFVFEPLRAYLAGEWRRAGLKFERANDACGTASMAGRHYFSRSQWCLPTAEHYASLQIYANAHGENHGGEYLRREYEYLRREYEDLRREYEDLRREYEDLRRPFGVTADIPYTDVWDFATVRAFAGKHPAEKPLELMAHIVRVSSQPGDLVLDSFAGRGTTLVAARALGRRAVGIEMAERWCDAAVRRLARSFEEAALGKRVEGEPLDSLPLFVVPSEAGGDCE